MKLIASTRFGVRGPGDIQSACLCAVNMYVYMCVCVYTYVYIYIYTFAYTHIYICVHVAGERRGYLTTPRLKPVLHIVWNIHTYLYINEYIYTILFAIPHQIIRRTRRGRLAQSSASLSAVFRSVSSGSARDSYENPKPNKNTKIWPAYVLGVLDALAWWDWRLDIVTMC